jgi:malate dehydrogenase (oxaloacetate-decarboxylating)(NADP+)
MQKPNKLAMKCALAREPVPEEVLQAYQSDNLSFGRDYIIPKPFDPRLLSVVSGAVADAARLQQAAAK